jgi:hypothetical protein
VIFTEMQQIGNKKVINRRTKGIICNTFDYITFPFEALTKICFLRIYFFNLFSENLNLPFTAFMRNLTLTIQFCDISQSFVSATKYENTSIVYLNSKFPLPVELCWQNKNISKLGIVITKVGSIIIF